MDRTWWDCPGNTATTLEKPTGAWGTPEAPRSGFLRGNKDVFLCLRYLLDFTADSGHLYHSHGCGEEGAMCPFHGSLSSLTGPSVPTLLLTSWCLETISTTDLFLCALALPCQVTQIPLSLAPIPWQHFAALNFLLPTTSPLECGLKYHLLSKSCSLPPAHLSSRCFLCSSSSMTHDMAFYCYHCNLLLFPNPQPAFPSLLVTTQVLPAVSSRADVGPCHPKANPPGSSSIAQAAHWKGAPGLQLSLGKPSTLLNSPARKRKDLR